MATKMLKVSFLPIIALISILSAAFACNTSADCFGQGEIVPVDNTHYVKYECFNGQCIKGERIEVECINDAACPIDYTCNKDEMVCEPAEKPEIEPKIIEPQAQENPTDYSMIAIILIAIVTALGIFGYYKTKKN